MRNKRSLILFAAIGVLALGCEEEKTPVTQVAPIAEVEPRPGPVTSAQLSVEQTREFGPYIADSDGRALYLLEGEADGEADCYAGCAQVWRPFIAPQSSPEAVGPSVQENLIGTVRREDGSAQVTYNGHPLYYYVRDLGPGQATGQDVTDAWGEWYLVTPDGIPLENHEQESTDSRISVAKSSKKEMMPSPRPVPRDLSEPATARFQR